MRYLYKHFLQMFPWPYLVFLLFLPLKQTLQCCIYQFLSVPALSLLHKHQVFSQYPSQVTLYMFRCLLLYKRKSCIFPYTLHLFPLLSRFLLSLLPFPLQFLYVPAHKAFLRLSLWQNTWEVPALFPL